MRFAILSALLVLVCSNRLSFASGPAAPRAKLASYDWSTTASPNLGRNPPPKKLVENLIRSLELAETGFSIMGDKDGTYVCSFTFADLRHNGMYSLVAGIGVTDRPSCRGITIIDKTSAGFESCGQGGEIGSGSDVAAQIRDLNHDGHLEILLSYGLGSLEQRCAANWTAIYAWTGNGYTNVSDQFKDFYRQRLDLVKRIIPTLGPIPNQEGYALSDKECLEAEASAITRFLGISADAGLDQAIRLTESKDRLEREFGTILLIQIGTPETRKLLEKLVNDPDYGVAMYAKNGLTIPRKMKFAPPSFR
ncbi:MAG TPA: hypothetical protein VEC38_06220 [Candidatus Binataceae bacterium]|nr:hypothetical protein [Candidatus Binataceae bacterium]